MLTCLSDTIRSFLYLYVHASSSRLSLFSIEHLLTGNPYTVNLMHFEAPLSWYPSAHLARTIESCLTEVYTFDTETLVSVITALWLLFIQAGYDSSLQIHLVKTCNLFGILYSWGLTLDKLRWFHFGAETLTQQAVKWLVYQLILSCIHLFLNMWYLWGCDICDDLYINRDSLFWYRNIGAQWLE